MPEGSGIGLYPYGEVADSRENDEVSSTYEGRHLTFYSSEITGHEHAFPTKGHPVVVGEDIVGVILAINRADGTIGAASNAAGDLVTIDTEGIFLQSVVALNPAAIAVVAGDELFINKTTGIISNDSNKNTHAHFGYALGGVTAGNTAIISVKVHWDPDDAEERVGVTGVPLTSAEVSKSFRQYFYESTGGSYIRGEDFELTIPSTSARVYEAIGKRIELTIPGDAWVCTGMVTPLDIGLVVTAGDVNMGTWGVLTLRFDCENTMGNTNHADAYIHLRDAHEDLYNTQAMAALLSFYDHEALDDGGVTLGFSILQDSNTDHASDVRIACEYGSGNSRFWLMGTTTPPD